jgi:hypothetical protein
MDILNAIKHTDGLTRCNYWFISALLLVMLTTWHGDGCLYLADDISRPARQRLTDLNEARPYGYYAAMMKAAM